MNCETLRERLTQDPTDVSVEFGRHAETCVACAAYARRVHAAEALIGKALRFDLAGLRRQSAAGVVHAADSGSADRKPAAVTARAWVPAIAAAAGSVIGALAVWFLLAPSPEIGADLLAREVVEHWYQEPESWVRSDAEVSASVLDSVLDGKALIDLTSIGTVSYARSCFVAGQWVPHLVVQGEAGPFMVLLMPEQSLESPVQLTLSEQGLNGRALPVNGGSIAVLGADAIETAEVEQAVVSAVEWTI